MPSVKIAKGKGLFGCLRCHGGPKGRIGCETKAPSAKEDTECNSTVAADSPIDRSFQTSTDAPASPNNSGRSVLSEDKKSKDLDDTMPRFFYEEKAHEDSPYVTIFSDH